MALYGVFYQTGIFPPNGEPLYTMQCVTGSELEAIEETEKLVHAGKRAWYEQIQ